ncbi:hypothetical protein DICVIV_01557 [Dictyocaulus viviparus]|uniref:Uncharacterized protein n=1 Tax=Dictyocaulus viviparus TaxID=29172 RepID=A0A0D8Y8D6_DICVI|nr:hypothetical protein DICVIV_01557 [Dictyocaulus viviparus]
MKDDYVVPNVLLSEIRHAISSARNRTASGPDRIRPEHLKSLPPVLIKTLARLITRYLSECKVPSQWKTSRTTHRSITRALSEKSLCLTFIDIKKVFDSVEAEAVMEALTNQALPTPYIKILRELYKNSTTKFTPFYKDKIINDHMLCPSLQNPQMIRLPNVNTYNEVERKQCEPSQ